MKLTLSLLASFLVSTVASAAPASLLVQILTNSDVARYTDNADVEKIEQTAQYRCPGCYDFTITQRTPVGEQKIKVATHMDQYNHYLVNVVEVSK